MKDPIVRFLTVLLVLAVMAFLAMQGEEGPDSARTERNMASSPVDAWMQ